MCDSNNHFFYHNQCSCGKRNCWSCSLTALQETINLTQCLPVDFDPDHCFHLVRDRLHSPEREVRQFALHLLTDLIPLIDPIDDLDRSMNILLVELIDNLGFNISSVRKWARTALQTYIQCTEQPNGVLRALFTTIPDENQLKCGVVMAVPHLIRTTSRIGSDTLSFVLYQLIGGATKCNCLQPIALEALAKIWQYIGADRFQNLLDTEVLEQFLKLCSDHHIVLRQDHLLLDTELELEQCPSSITMEYYDDDDDDDESADDSSSISAETYQNEVGPTGRKVHFGGEVVKMRTPESDSTIPVLSNGETLDKPPQKILKIKIHEEITIDTSAKGKSHIPIPVSSSSSEPSTPISTNTTKNLAKEKQHRSTSDLPESKIPLRQQQNPTAYSSSSRSSPRRDEFSPIPVHNEIEVLHNLTNKASPEKSLEHSEEEEEGEEEEKVAKPKSSSDESDESKSKIDPEFLSKDTYNFEDLVEVLHDLLNENDADHKITHLDKLILILNQNATTGGGGNNGLKIPLREVFDTLLPMQTIPIGTEDPPPTHPPRLQQKVEQALNLAIDRTDRDDFTADQIEFLSRNGEVKWLLKSLKKSTLKLFFEILTDPPNEAILKCLIAVSRTFPRCEIDLIKGVEFACQSLADDEKPQIHQAGLEALACLAHLGGNTVVLEAVTGLDNSEQLLRVVRTRLSRKQLPIVDFHGNIRYSLAREQDEIDFIGGEGGSRGAAVSPTMVVAPLDRRPPPHISYWGGGGGKTKSSDDKSKIPSWTLSQSTTNLTHHQQLPKIEDANLCPVYIVPTTSTDREICTRTNRRNWQNQSFQKSFSSEQIPYRRPVILPSNSSRSSTTTTTSGSSSSKSGSNWLKSSSIPVPIVLPEKFRFPSTTTSRIPIGQQQQHPSFKRCRPINSNSKSREILPPPSPYIISKGPIMTTGSIFSSNSESSGYFTPPAEHHNFHNTTSGKCKKKFPSSPSLISDNFPESSDSDNTNEFQQQQQQSSIDNKPVISTDEEEEEEENVPPPPTSIQYRNSTIISTTSDHRIKSHSEINLLTTTTSLPDINSHCYRKKNINSAPPLNPGDEVPPPPQARKSPPPMMKPIRTTEQKPSTVVKRRNLKSDNGSDQLTVAIAQLESNSNDWETVIHGLNTLMRLCRRQPSLIYASDLTHQICLALARNIRNLRSQVARNACAVASELFASSSRNLGQKRAIEQELDELAPPLLQRTADTNKFLRSDANAALDVMALHLSIGRVVNVLATKGANHQNGLVRTTATRLMAELAARLGPDRVFQLARDVRDRFLTVGANGLTEGSLETRRYAKQLLQTLGKHAAFQKALIEAIPPSTLRHIQKTLRAIITTTNT